MLKSYTKFTEGFFRSKWLSKFINNGYFIEKQQKMERIIYNCFFLIKKKLKITPIFFFFEALEKLKPLVGLKLSKKKRRKVVKIHAVPYILHPSLRYNKAMLWLFLAIKTKSKGKAELKIFKELYSVNLLKNSLSKKKKKEFYKYAVMFKKNKQFKW